MARLSDEEFREMEGEQRHRETVAAIKTICQQTSQSSEQIAERIDKSIQRVLPAMNTAMNSRKEIDLRPLILEISQAMRDLSKSLKTRPTSYRVERDKLGFIERVVPEY